MMMLAYQGQPQGIAPTIGLMIPLNNIKRQIAQ